MIELGNVPERMVTMELPNNNREKTCYEECEQLIAQLEQLGYVLEDIEKDPETDHKVGAEKVGEIIDQLKAIQAMLAVASE